MEIDQGRFFKHHCEISANAGTLAFNTKYTATANLVTGSAYLFTIADLQVDGRMHCKYGICYYTLKVGRFTVKSGG